jgi:hypothetical protein
MSTLTSTSTLAEIQAAYIDNASYLEDGSVAKARAFITACTILLLKLPKRARHGGGGEEIELDPESVRFKLKAAEQYVSVNAGASAGGAGVKHVDFTGFRD